MADRQVTNYRQVTEQVVDMGSGIPEVLGGIVEKVNQVSNEAKINKNISQAQLELNQLANDYQVKYQGNPQVGAKEFASARNQILEKYGSDISPIYKQDWLQQTRQLATRSDLAMQNWQFNQTQKNVVSDINEAMELNLRQADMNGQSYGSGNTDELKSVLDFQSSYNKIYQTGASVIGAESAKAQMDGYKTKYINNFLSGVASVNSTKARELLNDEKFSDELTSADKQNILNKIVATENLEQQVKFEGYQAKADEAFTQNPYNFMEEANRISANGEAFRAETGMDRKSYDKVVAYNKTLVDRHKNNVYFDFYRNPSKEGLDYLQKLKPEMTDTEKDRLTEIYESTPNYEMTTTFSGYDSALMEIQKLATMPNETSEQKAEILNKSVDIVHKMKRSNLNAKDRESTLSQDDIDELSQVMYKSVNDSIFKKELADLPDTSIFNKIYDGAVDVFWNDGAIGKVFEGRQRANRIREIGLATSSNMIKSLMNGDRETADRIYQEGLEKAIKQKYYYLPEMQGKLEEGKTTFKINGKPYVFMGFGSEDIILEKLD